MSTKHAEIVIIGAGITGNAIAYFLAKNGMTDVIVVDKEGISAGMTRICPGGVRQQWGTEINCLMAKASTDFYERMNEELEPGIAIPFRQVGYMKLFHSERVLNHHRASVEMQNRFGIPTVILTPDEVSDIVKTIRKDSFIAASFGPTDGFVDSAPAVAENFANAAKRLGVRYIKREVTGIEAGDNKVSGIKTTSGTILCDSVVNAAGCDSPQLAATIGITLPIIHEKRRLLFTNKVEERILEPLIISFEKGFAGKQLADGSFYMSHLGADFNRPLGKEFEENAVAIGKEFVPAIDKLRILSHADGIYDSTPDHQSILGDIEGLTGYYQAIGMSGHGFMMAPATGRAMAELIVGKKPFIDISPLHYRRFSENRLIHEPSVV
jgi:sarcosine oxidase subunit beta